VKQPFINWHIYDVLTLLVTLGVIEYAHGTAGTHITNMAYLVNRYTPYDV